MLSSIKAIFELPNLSKRKLYFLDNRNLRSSDERMKALCLTYLCLTIRGSTGLPLTSWKPYAASIAVCGTGTTKYANKIALIAKEKALKGVKLKGRISETIRNLNEDASSEKPPHKVI